MQNQQKTKNDVFLLFGNFLFLGCSTLLETSSIAEESKSIKDAADKAEPIQETKKESQETSLNTPEQTALKLIKSEIIFSDKL